MMSIQLSAEDTIVIENIVFDFNGTLATDGFVSDRTIKRLEEISENIKVYVVTADTFKTVRAMFKNTKINVHIINTTKDKFDFVQKIGPEVTMAVGNGTNDSMMLKASVLGVGLLGEEGISIEAIKNCDLIVKNVDNLLNMLINPQKFQATLRK